MGDAESQKSTVPMGAETGQAVAHTAQADAHAESGREQQPAHPVPPTPTGQAPVQGQAQAPSPAPTQQMPPMVQPAPNAPRYAGHVYPAAPPKPHKKRRSGLLVVGIVVCVIAVALLAFAIYYVTNRSAESVPDANVDAPSSEMVEEAYRNADVGTPNLSSYSLVNTSDLQGPEISNVTIGEVSVNGKGEEAAVVCNTNAVAAFQNGFVKVTEPVTLRFTYDQGASEWKAGTVQASSPQVEPTAAPDVMAIQEQLPALLSAYDASIASQFQGAEIAASGDMTVEGGELTFALRKVNDDGTSAQCDVNVDVSWKNGVGWNPTINWVGEITGDGAVQPQPGENPEGGKPGPQDPSSSSAGTSSGASTPSSGSGEMLLECFTGDLVEIPGIIEYQNDRVILRADTPIHVILDGRSYTARYFELIANNFMVTVGSHVAAIGEISATGTLPQAPLVINLDF